jgi:hypothetical protein
MDNMKQCCGVQSILIEGGKNFALMNYNLKIKNLGAEFDL